MGWTRLDGYFTVGGHGLLDEICGLSGELQMRHGDAVCRPTIEIAQGVDDKALKPTGIGTVLKISAGAMIPDSDQVVWQLAPDGSLRKVPHHIDAFADTLAKWVFDLVVVGSIAQPGSTWLRGGRISHYSQPIHETSQVDTSFLREVWLSDYHVDRSAWNILPFHKTWTWCQRQKGFSSGFSACSSARALNAFASLLCSHEDPMGLFWSLVGIEALYVRGSQGAREQVRDKIPVLFGDNKTIKKRLVDMYRQRSKLVHGEMDFLGPRLSGEESIIQDYLLKHSEAVDFASSVLVATIQKMVVADLDELDFKRSYTLVGL
mgnify:CR=1 FL=1